MGDLISRQAAIDEVVAWMKDRMSDKKNGKPLTERLRDLPSAQPEIIKCKGCRHGVDYYHEGDCYCSNPKWGLMYFGGSWEFYCADAERRING